MSIMMRVIPMIVLVIVVVVVEVVVVRGIPQLNNTHLKSLESP